MKDYSDHKPSSVHEAVALLAAGGESRPLSGGMTLLPTMKQRLASPSALIDLSALSELSGITIEGGNVTIGAMTTHAEVAGSAALKATIPAQATLAGLIGDPQVRHLVTIRGFPAHPCPLPDDPAPALHPAATHHHPPPRICPA